MTNHKSKVSGVLVLIAGAVLCFPQVAGAAAPADRPPSAAGGQIHPQANTPVTPAAGWGVVLIPPLVIAPDPPAGVVRKTAHSRSVAVAPHVSGPLLPVTGPLLPVTGPSHTGVLALIGLGLIGFGLLVRRSAVR